ncbi:MAG: PRC-barrel domain-containing protein [Elusimicrobiota bacterium]
MSVFKVQDLAQCQVFTMQGECLGRVVDVLPSGGNDIFVVQHETREILIPALKSVVRVVDLDRKRIEVELPAGLREIYESKATPPA